MRHATPLSLEQEAAIGFLSSAASRSRQLGYDIWQFAVELRDLIAAGVSRCDLRTLVALGLVEHALEEVSPGQPSRNFRPCPNLTIPDKACFVLSTSAVSNPAERGTAGAPRWDAERRVLSRGGGRSSSSAAPPRTKN